MQRVLLIAHIEHSLSEQISGLGYGVAIAADFDTARELMHPLPDAILVHPANHGMADRFALCVKLRGQAALAAVPIMLLAEGRIDQWQHAQANDVGVNFLVGFPLASEVLASLLHGLMALRPETAQ